MSLTSPTTEIEAVNSILATIGEAPVSSIDPDASPDLALAYSTLQEVTREVLVSGWSFNSDRQVEYSPAVDGTITIPSNVVFLRPSTLNTGVYTVRSGLLYSMTRRSDQFESSVLLDQIVLLPFTDLPESCRRFITVKASRLFSDRALPSQLIHAVTQQDEDKARLLFERQYELQADNGGPRSFFNNDYFRRVNRGDGPLERYSG